MTCVWETDGDNSFWITDFTETLSQKISEAEFIESKCGDDSAAVLWTSISSMIVLF